MPKGDVVSTASGMLSDLKSRLGFSHDNGARDNARDKVDDGFDAYDDFDDDGFSERYDSEFAGYGADYDENAPVGGYRPARTRSGRFGGSDTASNLVSLDDVRANTPLPGEGSTPTSRGRNVIDDRAPAESSPAYNASMRDRAVGSSSRTESFTPTFEPYSPAVAGFGGKRGLSVIRPVTYSDAERIARSLKAGDIVVLAMRSTPDDLMQRILDFSFGVASVLDANVESPASRVFAIACGGALTDEEKRELASQGVM